ncbi:MAG: hypothetical protein KatS3mg035_0991 [Bacteroidia bacterium]|nr:MAG: hypothetical protein KatS3mg035_0991 [Bacteroidia bacterium]
MPNHVTNILTFKGKEKEIKKLRNAIKGKFSDGEEMFIDFNKIIPRPKSLDITSGSSTDYGVAVIMFREQNNPSRLIPVMQYPWVKNEGIKDVESLANYLVKNNMADLKEGRLAIENLQKYGHMDWYSWSNANWGTKWNAYSQSSDDLHTINFDTAWATPFPVIQRLSEMFPEVEIHLKYADEDFSHNCGEVTLVGGNEISSNIPEGGSMEAILLAGEVQGFDLDRFLDYYGESDDQEFILSLIQAMTEKYSIGEIIDMAVSEDYHVSQDFLEVLKEVATNFEAYEHLEKIDKRLQEIE